MSDLLISTWVYIFKNSIQVLNPSARSKVTSLMRNYLIVLIVCFYCYTPLSAQEDDTPKFIWTPALEQIEQLLGVYQLEAAEPIIEQAKQETLAAHEASSFELAEFYIRLADLYRKINQLPTAEYYVEQAIAINGQLDANEEQLAVAYNLSSRVFAGMGEIKKAKAIARKGLTLKDNIAPYTLSRLYNTLGVAYYYEGKDYDKALEYFETCLQIREEVLSEFDSKLATSLNNIGVMYLHNFNQLDSAFQQFDKARFIHEKGLPDEAFKRADIYDNLGEVFARKKDFKKAKKYRILALNARLDEFGDMNPNTATSYENLARDLVLQEQYTAAMPYFEKTNYIRTNEYGTKHRYAIRAYIYQAEAYVAWGKLDSALVCLQRAIIGAVSSFDNTDIYTNPILEQETIYAKNRLLGALTLKGKTFYQKYQQSKKKEDLEQSLAAYTLAIQVIDKLREDYERSNSKEGLLERAMTVYEGAIRSNYEMLSHNKESMYVDNIFQIIEKSKSTLLLEALREDEARAFAGIPASVMEDEKAIQYELFSVEKQLFEAQQSKEETDQALIPELKKAVRKIRGEADSIMRIFKADYPEYHQLKYDIELVDIETAKSLLPNDKHSLIEYFVGEDFIYAIIIQEEHVDIQRIEKDFPLEKWIIDLRTNIGASTNPSNKAAINIVTQKAHQLYQKLIAPIEKNCDLKEGLTIIPSGILGYLPFELLIKEAHPEASFFGNHRYLIQDYAVSYCYSATLLHEMQELQHDSKSQGFLAFAPSFPKNALPIRVGDNTTELTKLKYNIPEIEALNRLLDGEAFIKENATKAEFLRQAPQYKIIHLATHGLANDKVGDYAFLAFYQVDDTLSHQLLYNRDLYDLDLQADLVVLSACETGIGELKSGEGIISLARGFSYAGSKSIITTLWNINDERTQEIMLSFYTYLKEGRTKDDALRQAKLDFIDNYSHSAHPFYWAAFVPVGDMEVIHFDTCPIACPILGLGVLLLAFLLGRRFFKNASIKPETQT